MSDLKDPYRSENKKLSRRELVSYGLLAPPALLYARQSVATEASLHATKPELTVMNDRPFNAETPMHLLDDDITPTERLFVRNNGFLPEIAYGKGIEKWQLEFSGELARPRSFSKAELIARFQQHTYQLTLECGGNGRAGFFPPTKGNQWTYGAVGCPEWRGIRLRDVLDDLGVKESAVYVAYYGYDRHPSGDPNKVVISRGFPIAKSREDTTLIAFEMNGKALPPAHGFPARLVCPGYPGSTSGKWLKKIWIRDQVHDGPKMTGESYRVPRFPIRPGEQVPKKDMVILEQMPVKSIITSPQSGIRVAERNRKNVEVRGFAWTGAKSVTSVDITCDFGQNWTKTKLKNPRNPFAWQRWSVNLELPSKGYFEIWARATDSTGKAQPMVVPGWNPKGYANNASPRIAINVV